MGIGKRRINVMVSSTTKDLELHRHVAIEAINRLQWTPRVMEYDEAISREDPISYSLKLVDDAEVYLGIFGNCYGFQPQDPRNPDKISITEMEYRRAIELELDLLIFINDPSHSFKPELLEDETDADRAQLARFKGELRSKHIVSFYSSPQELRSQIIQSLYKLKENPDFKTKYLDYESSIKPQEASYLPQPPELYAHPTYTLTTEFVGRKDELRYIDQWANSDDTVMIVEAIGGVGKSAVTWHWVQSCTNKNLKLDGILWWSFYEQGATLGNFVQYALAYLTKQHPNTFKGNNVKANFDYLQSILNQGCYLLVLDGLERILVAYHRWNAAQMRDDTIEDTESIIKDRNQRTCIDPTDEQILQRLLTCQPSKILISSRLLPLALENRAGNLQSGVQHMQLKGLDSNDALALARQQGVSVKNEHQFKTFMKKFDNHSLLIMLVAGQVNKFKRAPGDFDRWFKQIGDSLLVHDLEVTQNQSHILKYALNGLDDQQNLFLSQIAAFNNAVDYETVAIFNPFSIAENANDAYPNLDESPQTLAYFDALLDELEQRGLLYWNRKENTYDMHPIVRGYAFERLEGKAKTLTFEQIEQHFRSKPSKNVSDVQEFSDLSNTIMIYHALLGAGKLDKAAQFFIDRLHLPLHYYFMAYYTIFELLIPLFQAGTDTLPTLQNKTIQRSITQLMAKAYGYIEEYDQSLHLFSLNIKSSLDEDDSGSLILSLLNYSTLLAVKNQVALSFKACKLALILAEAINDVQKIARCHLLLFLRHISIGEFREAKKFYQQLQDNPPDDVYLQSTAEILHAILVIDSGEQDNSVINKAESLAQQSRDKRGEMLLKELRGKVELQNGNHDIALDYFKESIEFRRNTGLASTAKFFSNLARTYLEKGDYKEAKQIVEDDKFDDSLVAAKVYLSLGETDKARYYAIDAYREAWADGLPYVRWRQLNQTKAILDTLNEPYPDMLPFDEQDIGTLPYEDEINTYIYSKKSGF